MSLINDGKIIVFMSKLGTAIRIFKLEKTEFRSTLFYLLRKWKLLNILSDKAFVQLGYYLRFGEKLDLSNPKSFNQKLNWLKLNNKRPEYSLYVDKYAVKDYVSKTLGEGYAIPTLGIWDDVNSIEWDSLPNEFVIKCTHDSHSYIICKDKTSFDIDEATSMLAKKMKRNLYWWAREWPYRNVKPRIVAEPFLKDSESEDLKDYKFFCFDGVVKCFKVDFDRFSHHGANYYDINGNILEIGEEVCPPDFSRHIILPRSIPEMISLAEKLSKGIPFVRVDFYDVNGHVYFGEMTFFPAEGYGRFTSMSSDYMMGEWINIDDKL